MVPTDHTKDFDTANSWNPRQNLKCYNPLSRGDESAIVSDGEFSHSFAITNGTKPRCVMALVLFVLLKSVIFRYVFPGMDTGVKFNFWTRVTFSTITGSNQKHFFEPSVIHHLLFADDAELVTRSLEEAQWLFNPFFVACKGFGLTISIIKTGVNLPADSSPKADLGCQTNSIRSSIPRHSYRDWWGELEVCEILYIFRKYDECNERGVKLDDNIQVYRAGVLTTL